MESVMQVMQLQDGNWAVRSIGGNTLNAILAQFATQAEAEEWMMRNTRSAGLDPHILRPGGGQAVS